MAGSFVAKAMCIRFSFVPLVENIRSIYTRRYLRIHHASHVENGYIVIPSVSVLRVMNENDREHVLSLYKLRVKNQDIWHSVSLLFRCLNVCEVHLRTNYVVDSEGDPVEIAQTNSVSPL